MMDSDSTSGGNRHNPFNGSIGKGADNHRPEMKRNRLQVNIFRRMAMIHGDIAESPLPVLAGCPCKDGALSTEVPLSKRGWGSCTNSVAYPGAAFFSMV
jgi:hypothetical protein